MRGRTLDKSEAINILRELFSVCPEIGNADFVSLDNVKYNSKSICRLRLKVDLDNRSKTAIRPILKAHKLEMKITENLVDIFRLPTCQ